MQKSGRMRKAKRRVRKRAEAELTAVGDHWRAGTLKEERENNELVRRSLRWKTDAVGGDYQGADPGEMENREVATLVTRRNMLSTDQQVANAAVRNLISMEVQNQADEKVPEKKTPQRHIHLHRYAGAPSEAILEAKVAFVKLRKAAVDVEVEEDGGEAQ